VDNLSFLPSIRDYCSLFQYAQIITGSYQ
jgi:hypothetical protein